MKSAWTRISIVFLTIAVMIAGGELFVRFRLPGYAAPPPPPLQMMMFSAGAINRQAAKSPPCHPTGKRSR